MANDESIRGSQSAAPMSSFDQGTLVLTFCMHRNFVFFSWAVKMLSRLPFQVDLARF